MNSTIHHLVSTSTPGRFECRTSTDCVCVICISFPRLAQRPVLSPSRPQCLKLSLTWCAGCCKPLTHTHYFRPPHNDQSVRLQGSPRRRGFYLYKTQNSQETDLMPLAGFEPAIPASERPQTHALDRAATGIGLVYEVCRNIICRSVINSWRY